MPPKTTDKEKNGDEPPKQRRRPGRVPVSCAECRRLKLRCDRKVPCETCTKRGCASICPNGSLTTGKASNRRYVLANTEELHARIEHLTARVGELEGALRALQSTVAPDVQHPLLKEELLLSSTPDSAGSSTRSSPPQQKVETDEEEGVLNAFGTMSIGSKGATRFLGPTARSEFLIQAYQTIPPNAFYSVTRLDERILTAPFPEAEREDTNDDIRQLVWGYLPPLSEACSLCELYLEKSTFIFSSVTRKQLFDEILGVIYRTGSLDDNTSYHALSLLFVIFAITKIFDMSRENWQVEAHEYFLLSRVALTFESPLRTTTVVAVQAMTYMAQYLDYSESSLLPSGSSKAWLYLGYAVKLAHSMGLHLNAKRWKLCPEETERRNRVFWHLFSIDTWCSFGFGRPPSTNLAFIDCDLPTDHEEHTNEDGSKSMSFHRWNALYSQLLYNIMVTAFSAKPPQYIAIMELDRQVREVSTPEYLLLSDSADSIPTEVACQRWIIHSNKEWTLLNVHRAYYAVALREKPTDLLKHKYGPSVMATYRAGYRMIEGAEVALRSVDRIWYRSNFACSKILTAVIVVCLLVCNAPSSDLAPASLEVLDRGVAFFEYAASKGSWPASESLAFVKNLQRQGHEAMDKTKSHIRSPLSAAELERLGGMTQLVSQQPLVAPPVVPEALRMPVSAPPARPAPAPSHLAESTILQDLQSFVTPGMQYNFFEPTSAPAPAPASAPASAPAPPNFTPMQQDMAFGAGVGAFDFSEDFTQPSVFTGSQGVQQAPYMLDATWQDFVQQLGF